MVQFEGYVYSIVALGCGLFGLQKGVTVLVSDPGRLCLPEMKFQIEAQYLQEASHWFEDYELCRAKVLSLVVNGL